MGQSGAVCACNPTTHVQMPQCDGLCIGTRMMQQLHEALMGFCVQGQDERCSVSQRHATWRCQSRWNHEGSSGVGQEYRRPLDLRLSEVRSRCPAHDTSIYCACVWHIRAVHHNTHHGTEVFDFSFADGVLPFPEGAWAAECLNRTHAFAKCVNFCIDEFTSLVAM